MSQLGNISDWRLSQQFQLHCWRSWICGSWLLHEDDYDDVISKVFGKKMLHSVNSREFLVHHVASGAKLSGTWRYMNILRHSTWLCTEYRASYLKIWTRTAVMNWTLRGKSLSWPNLRYCAQFAWRDGGKPWKPFDCLSFKMQITFGPVLLFRGTES